MFSVFNALINNCLVKSLPIAFIKIYHYIISVLEPLFSSNINPLYITGSAILRKTKSIPILPHLSTPFTILDF